jgi:hypothetical protein
MKYVQASLLMLTLISSIKTLAMNEENTALKSKTSASGYLNNPNFFNRGVDLATFQAAVFAIRINEEYQWIVNKSRMHDSLKGNLEPNPPYHLTALRLTNRVCTLLLAGFAYEVYLYQRYFKDLKSE